ncbi:MAG: hypothetical protein L0G87_16845, partial [Renibacterium salmoninarum]|nr:hypothetical protein [Renibacterium salmoninarum]
PSLSFGEPAETLPEAQQKYPPAPHWAKVAKYCQAKPDAWHPVRLGHLTRDGHRTAAAAIRRHTYAAFRGPEWEAAYRDGELYVRYNTRATGSVSTLRAVNA